VVWREGMEMGAHDDICQGKFPNREYSALVYLNDDYEGGYTLFPDIEFGITPERGTLVVFKGGTLRHAVSKVTKGNRYTALSWLHPGAP